MNKFQSAVSIETPVMGGSARTVVLADAHIGSPECNRVLLSMFFNELFTVGCSNLVLLGDTFDLWQSSADNIKKNHGGIVDLISHMHTSGRCKVTLVLGNHDRKYLADPVLHKSIQPVEYHIMYCGSSKIMMLHGHQFDSSLKDITQPVSDRINCALRSYLSWSYKSLGENIISLDPSIKKQREAAVQRFAPDGYSAVITGHTHYPEQHLKGESTMYVNAGDWKKHNTYVEINDGAIEIKRYSEF